MRSCCIAALLILASCRVSSCFANEEAAGPRPTPIDPLTRGRAAQILAQADNIAENLSQQLRNLRNPAEARVIDDLSEVLSHASEWRWYSRDRGILIAIPVKERLGLLSSYHGEKTLADIVRRLINQKALGNPHVQVVLVEPKYPMATQGGGIGQSAECLYCLPAVANTSCNCP